MATWPIIVKLLFVHICRSRSKIRSIDSSWYVAKKTFLMASMAFILAKSCRYFKPHYQTHCSKIFKNVPIHWSGKENSKLGLFKICAKHMAKFTCISNGLTDNSSINIWMRFFFIFSQIFCHFSKWCALKTLRNFEKSSKMAKLWQKIKKSLVHKLSDESFINP